MNIEIVEADDLVKFGGAFNCASWTTTQQAFAEVASVKFLQIFLNFLEGFDI